MCCPACTSASFGTEGMTSKMESPESKKDTRPRHYTMTWDVREEFVGLYSTFKEKQDVVGKDQSCASTDASSGPQHPGNEMDEGTTNVPTGMCNWNFGCY